VSPAATAAPPAAPTPSAASVAAPPSPQNTAMMDVALWGQDRELIGTNVNIKLRSFPTAAQVNDWFAHVRDTLASSSKDSDKTIAWFREALDPNVPDHMLLEPGEGFKRMDLKLASAIIQLDSNARQFLTVKNKRSQLNRELERQCKTVTGRLLLRLIKAEFAVNEHIDRAVKLQRLNTCVWTGDNNIEKFYFYWQKCVADIDPTPAEELLQATLENLMRQSKELEWDMKMYDQHRECRTYSFLLQALEQKLHLERERQNLQVLSQALGNKKGSSADRGSHSKGRGKGKKGGKSGQGSGPSAAPASPPAPANSQNKQSQNKSNDNKGQKGKGSGGKRGSSRERSQKRDSSKQPKDPRPCKKFQNGTCTNESCRFTHRLATPEEQAEWAKNDRSQSPNRPKQQNKGKGKTKTDTKKIDCRHWLTYGSCSFGDGCKFNHDAAKRGRGKALPPPDPRHRTLRTSPQATFPARLLNTTRACQNSHSKASR
jgi:hypothetical protein